MEWGICQSRKQQSDRYDLCVLITLALTALAWVSGPVVVSWLPALASRMTAFWLALVILCVTVWPSFRAALRTFFRPELAPILWCFGVCLIGSWLAWLPGGIQVCLVGLSAIPGFFCFWPTIKQKPHSLYPRPPDDQLRRYPLIRGIMRTVMAGRSDAHPGFFRTRINRIALTGPWGCGKTLVLDHVAFALQDHGLARAVKVSPWVCTTVAEARECLAEGMRVLLGEASYHEVPLLRGALKSVGAADLVDAVFTDVTSARKASLQALDEHLGRQEDRTGKRMIMVIDDMERAEPNVVRALLPLLSDLLELKHCTFLIAIDEGHFRAAFATDLRDVKVSPAKPDEDPDSINPRSPLIVAAEGFLQKVFDLRIEMPIDPPADRIAAMARLKVGLSNFRDSLIQPHLLNKPALAAEEYPKLKAALPFLTAHLPTNPRELERFLDKARLYEICFLADYSSVKDSMFDRDGDWTLFFHLWLLDSRFPGFAKSFAAERPSGIVSVMWEERGGLDDLGLVYIDGQSESRS
jgi:hypothetical protein